MTLKKSTLDRVKGTSKEKLCRIFAKTNALTLQDKLWINILKQQKHLFAHILQSYEVTNLVHCNFLCIFKIFSFPWFLCLCIYGDWNRCGLATVIYFLFNVLWNIILIFTLPCIKNMTSTVGRGTSINPQQSTIEI